MVHYVLSIDLRSQGVEFISNKYMYVKTINGDTRKRLIPQLAIGPTT